MNDYKSEPPRAEQGNSEPKEPAGYTPWRPEQQPGQAQRPYGGDWERENRSSYDARRTGAYGRRGPNPPPYQYSASTGWQQPQQQPEYQWDFAEYDRAMPPKKQKRNRGLVVFAVSLLCVLSVSLLALTGYNIVKSLSPGEESTEVSNGELPSESVGESLSPSGDGEVSMTIQGKPQIVETMPSVGEKMTIPQVAKTVRPTVVGIVNYQSGEILEPYTEGSGIIMSPDGYIVTNAHVVAGAEAIVVVFDDESEVEAQVIGSDARTDLAVLKVDREGLTPAIFGDSDELEVGETVIAIGNPGGTELAGSVTQGIVSAVNRVMRTPYYSTNYIQTDAAVNPGNSGGALCNEFGQVVGINSAKIVAEGYEGISFAIPINEAIPIVEDLIAHGRVTGRVLLGITGEPVSDVIARNRNIPAGVQILTITSDELINRGVLRGDIITHIDGERIFDLNDVRAIIESHKAGDMVVLTLYRQTRVTTSNTFDVEVPLMEDTGQ